MTGTWHQLLDEGAFPAEGKIATIINNWSILIARTDQGLFAVNDRCPHQGAVLSTGRVHRGAITCAHHGARFDVSTGRCIGGTYRDLRTFAVRIIDARIEICVPDAPPGIDERPIRI